MQYVKKNEIPDLRKEKITAVCIDDFAIKKGHTYGTIMVDIKSRRVVDMIETRELEQVKEWLQTFPSLRYVARDGSIIYRSAITQANKNIIQISDRFHLLKGLTDAAKKFIIGYFKANIGLPVSNSHYDGKKTAFYWKKDTGRIDAPAKKHIAAAERKIKLVQEARKLQKEGYAPRVIAGQIGVSVITAKKYLQPDFIPVSSGYNATHKCNRLTPYAEVIKQMLSKGNTFKEIENLIRHKGYEGSASAIRMFSTRVRRVFKTTGVLNAEKVERKWLVSLLYKPIDKVNELSQEQLNKVISEKPILGQLYYIVKAFKEALFSKKVSMSIPLAPDQ